MAARPSAEHAHHDGHEVRQKLPRRDQATLTLPTERDPVGIIEAQNATRLTDLVGVRMGRMLQSPFAYYRGTAAQMAADLAAGADSDIAVVSSGDAHIANFGFFASPERDLLFDLNDFDEAALSPWEWDLKRMATSVYLCGRDIGASESDCHDATAAAVAAYQHALADLTQMRLLDRYYFDVDMKKLTKVLKHSAEKKQNTKAAKKLAKKARGRTSDQVLGKMTTHTSDGQVRITDQEPLTRHVDHISLDALSRSWMSYLTTVREDIAVLLSQYEPTDFVLRVGGVGSVGTRCYLLLLTGPSGEPLFLQAKESDISVLEEYGGRPSAVAELATIANHPRPGRTKPSQGHRVVSASRVLQAQSDPFLGWAKGPIRGGSGRASTGDFYWRQFRDMKESVDLTTLDPTGLTEYAEVCAALLARAHSQSPAAYAASGYAGRSGPLAEAIAQWARVYADVCEADFEALQAAGKSGRVPVETGV